MVIVFDASLAVKWFVDEVNSDSANQLLRRHEGEIAVPELFVTEVVGALVRRANMDKTLRSEVEFSISRLIRMIENHMLRVNALTPAQTRAASRLALDLGHPLKDCLYVILAMDLGCPLVTADARFVEKARGVYGDVRGLGE